MKPILNKEEILRFIKEANARTGNETPEKVANGLGRSEVLVELLTFIESYI